jgi:hypothetical protein
MSERPTLWVEDMCRRLAPIERETLEKLGEKEGGFFVWVAEDWIKINTALVGAYPGKRGYNLVRLTFGGLLKEVCWFHFFFVAGNYPLLLSRLRFVWEAVFRAFLVENYPLRSPVPRTRRPRTRRPRTRRPPPAPGPSPDDKVGWLYKHERNLNWAGCIEPVLRKVFPLADEQEKVRDDYHKLLDELHKYVHPSADLAGKMIGESALHVIDNFDEGWALETVEIARKVFDLVWLAVLQHHPLAFERVEPLSGDYPILKMVIQDERGDPRHPGRGPR